MHDAAVQEPRGDQTPPLAVKIGPWDARAIPGQMRLRADQLGYKESEIDQQNHNCGKANLWNKSAEKLASRSPVDGSRSHFDIAVRTYLVVTRNERPAIRAHPALV